MEDLRLIRKELIKMAEIAHKKLQKQGNFLFDKMDIWLVDILTNGDSSKLYAVDMVRSNLNKWSVEELLNQPMHRTTSSYTPLLDLFCQVVEEDWFMWFYSNMGSLKNSNIDEKIWFMEVSRVVEDFDLSPRFGSDLWKKYFNRPLRDVIEKWEEKVIRLGRDRALQKSRELTKIEIETTIIALLDKKLRQQKIKLKSWQDAWIGLEELACEEHVNPFTLGILAYSAWFDAHYDPNFVMWVRQRVKRPEWCVQK